MWTTILSWLGNLLGGPFVKAALDAYKAKLAAGNDSERIAADLAAKDVELRKREDELNAQILVAEQGNWFTRWVRPLWAMPFVIYTWKLVVWDKVLGHWTQSTTDPLTGGMETLIVTVSSAYFIGRSAEIVARIIKK